MESLEGGTSAVSCCFCCKAHASTLCPTVSDVAERKLILRRSGRCFVCLKKYHMTRDCLSCLRCSNCNGRHHVSIYSETSWPVNRVPKPTVTPKTDLWPVTRSTGTSNGSTIHLTLHQARFIVGIWKYQFYCKLLRFQDFRPDYPQGMRNVWLIFDSGSQRWYSTNKLKETYWVKWW